MPFRRRSRNSLSRRASSPGKENNGLAADHEPLSPRLVRCQSDNCAHQRTFGGLSANAGHGGHGHPRAAAAAKQTLALSADEKMSNLVELNASLVKEVSSLRVSQRELSDQIQAQEESLQKSQACNDRLLLERNTLQDDYSKLQLEISSLREETDRSHAETIALLAEKQELLAAKKELQDHLSVSCSREEGMSQKLQAVQEEMSLLLEELRHTRSSAENQLDSIVREVEELRAENSRLVQEVAFFKEDISRMGLEKTALLADKQKLLLEMDNQEAQLSAFNEKRQELERLLEEEKKAAVAAKDKLFHSTYEMEQLLRERGERIDCLEALLEKSSSELKGLMADMDEEKHNHGHEMARCKEEVSHLADKVRSLAEEKERVSAQLEELLVQEQENNLAMKDETDKLRLLNKKLVKEVTSRRQEADHLGSRCKALLAENQSIIMEKETLEAAMSSSIAERSELIDQLAAEKKMAAAAEVRISELLRVKAELETRIAASLAQHHELAEKLQSERNATAVLNSQLLAEKAELEASLLAKKAQLETTLAGLLAEKTGLETSLSELSRQLQAVKKAASVAQENVCSLNADIAKLQVKNEQLLSQMSCLKEDANRLGLDKSMLLSEKMMMIAEKVELEGTISVLNAKAQEISEELEAEQKTALAGQESLASLTSEFESLQLENEKMQTEVAFLKEDSSRLSMEKITLLGEKQVMLAEKIELEGSLCELRENFREIAEQLRSEGTAAAAAQDGLMCEIEHLRLGNVKLTEENASLNSTVDRCEHEIKQLLSTVKSQEEELARLQVEAKVLESTSVAKNTSIEAEKALLESILEAKNEAVAKFEVQLEEAAEQVTSLLDQLAMKNGRISELEAHIEEKDKQAKIELNGLLKAKDEHAAEIKHRLSEACSHASLLESRLAVAAGNQTELMSQVKSLESNLVAKQNEVLQAEAVIKKCEAQLTEATKQVAILEAQLASKTEKQNELEVQSKVMKKDLYHMSLQAENGATATAAIREQLKEACKRVNVLEANLNSKDQRQNESESHIKVLTTELQNASLHSEKEAMEAGKRIQALEAQLANRAERQQELELHAKMVESELLAARAAAKEAKANLSSMLDTARERCLEEQQQLKPDEQGFMEMQSSEVILANKEIPPSSSLEKTSRSKRKANKLKHRKAQTVDGQISNGASTASGERGIDESNMQKARFIEEKSKMMRIALPVVLISASTLLYAGIQSYLRGLGN